MFISTYYQMSPKKLLTTILQAYHNIPQDIQRMTVSSAGRDQKIWTSCSKSIMENLKIGGGTKIAEHRHFK